MTPVHTITESAPRGASSPAAPRRFPDSFVWGSATSAYQIEGAVDADGRGESIWDRFCTRPDAILDRSSGAVACDHYHRVDEDVALMRSLGLGGYRFSIAWPRIQPDGRGPANAAGLDFYDRLVDRLLDAGVRPFATLYHWDLPQALEDTGGWPARETAFRFADYAELVADRLGDRVRDWATLNEPFVVANLGYLTGEHAPGRTSLADALAASHHLMLGHGLAVPRLRAASPGSRVGIVLNFTPVEPVGDSPAAQDRQRLVDEYENQWYSEVLGGFGYPAYATERLGWDQREVLPGDLELIATPLDVLGVNFYTRKWVGAIDGERGVRGPTTSMGWEIHPDTLGRLLRRLRDRYRYPSIFVTENGAAMPDTARDGERVLDLDRIGYLAAHLREVHAAIEDGVPVDGYFAWSLLDNFEWAFGYSERFGIVEVDFATQARIPKHSALWYARLAADGVLELPEGSS